MVEWPGLDWMNLAQARDEQSIRKEAYAKDWAIIG